MLRDSQRVRLTAGGLLCGLLAVGAPAAANADLQLVLAARNRDEAAVDALLRQGANVDAPQADGATALHWAAHWNDIETMERLLAAGAHVNAENALRATPLWAACAGRNTAAVQRLLAAGADAGRALRSGETLLMRCAYTGDPAAVRALLAHGADVDAREPSRGQTALMWAAASRQPAVTRVLIEQGAAIDARTRTVRRLHGTGLRSTMSPAGAAYFEAGGFTALLFAARHGDVDSARLLLDAGADVNQSAADGNSPLVVAAMSGHGRLAEFLLARGADPDAAGAGYGALHAAVLRADPALAQALLARGADPNARLTRGTPVTHGTYQFVFTLREKGATPLLLAAKYLEPRLLRLLAGGGADPLLTFDDGTTALMAAVGLVGRHDTTRRNRLIAPELVRADWTDEDRVLATVRAAVEAGAAAAIDTANAAGNTALHGAAQCKFAAVADFLAAQGADRDRENARGETPRARFAAIGNC